MKRKIKIYLILLLALTAISTAFRAFAVLYCYDSDVGLFRSEPLVAISSSLLIAGVLYSLVALPLFYREDLFCGKDRVATSKTWSILCVIAAACCFFAGISLITKRTDALSVATGICALFSAMHFLLAATADKTKSANRSEQLLPWLKITFLAALALLAVSFYIDMTIPTGSPFKEPLILAALFGGLFVISEARFDLQSTASVSHLITGAITFFLCCNIGISHLIYCVTLSPDAPSSALSDYTSPLLILALATAAAARLIRFTEDPVDTPPENSDPEDKIQ